jgi:hypothetical protein
MKRMLRRTSRMGKNYASSFRALVRQETAFSMNDVYHELCMYRNVNYCGLLRSGPDLHLYVQTTTKVTRKLIFHVLLLMGVDVLKLEGFNTIEGVILEEFGQMRRLGSGRRSKEAAAPALVATGKTSKVSRRKSSAFKPVPLPKKK